MNFFIEKTERYQQLSVTPNAGQVSENFNEQNPLENIIPYDFELITVSGTLLDGNLVAEYSNDNATVVFFVGHSIGKMQIDDEDAFVSECKVAGHDARLYIENETVRVAWLDENHLLTLNLCATNVSREAVEYFAEMVASYFG